MQIILLDTETTGLEPEARLVQLGYKNLSTGEEVNEYFKPPVNISYESMAIHHITEEMVANKPMFQGSESQLKLKKLLEDNILVAHNAPFDIKILSNEGVKTYKYIDTIVVAKHLIEAEQYRLQYLRYFLHLEVKGIAHDAMGDVFVLESLFQYLKEIIKEKFSLISDEDIYKKMLELTNMCIMLVEFSFGKYKGKTFDEVYELDKRYMKWLQSSEASKEKHIQDKDLVYTLNKYLGVQDTLL